MAPSLSPARMSAMPITVLPSGQVGAFSSSDRDVRMTFSNAVGFQIKFRAAALDVRGIRVSKPGALSVFSAARAGRPAES